MHGGTLLERARLELHLSNQELYADYFEYVCDTDVNSVVFRNTKKIPDSAGGIEHLPIAEKSELMDRAANRFHGRKREILLAAKAHFLEMLEAS